MNRIDQNIPVICLHLEDTTNKILVKKKSFKYTGFSTTYLSAQLPRKTYNFKGNQIIQRYTENTLHRPKSEMVNARLLVQQFTHTVHPNSSYRLSYLLRQFVDNTEKMRNRQQTKQQGEKQVRQYTGKHFSFQKSKGITVTCPRQIACSARQPKLSSLAAVASP